MSKQDPKSETSPPAKGRKGMMLLMGMTLLVSAGTAGYVWYSKSSAATAAEAPAPLPTSYYSLTPTFVVNLADDGVVRYLQADVEVLTRDADTLAALETHAPAMRNRMLLLLSQQTSETLRDRAGKEALQKAALAEVKAVLSTQGQAAKVDAVIFTSLVTQ